MRVITGLYKGRTIRTVKDLSVRPATDRVRQTIFNMLENRIPLEGSSVLDLFAGSGSLGIEALSRGAADVTFVETGRDAVAYLDDNLRMLGCESAAQVYRMDVVEFLGRHQGAHDLVFADPPYAYERTAELPALIFGKGMIRPSGYLLIEHAKDLHFDSTPHYHVGPEKRFGRTLVTFFQEQRS
jgi:16S rRNA (guanine(966)-N(2))-methyltransferase RsmD